MICKKDQVHVIVIIDVFRAFSTASYVLARNPATYMITTKSTVISRLALNFNCPLIIGKAEKGVDFMYHIPNSPTRVQEVKVVGRNVLHRTDAGAKGILLASGDIILATAFVNADATVQYIKTLKNPKVTIVPMGYEATTPSLEDNVCALYIKALLRDEKISLNLFLSDIKKRSGSYFFSADQWQYPEQDFERCMELKRFNFAIQAIVKEDYAILTCCN